MKSDTLVRESRLSRRGFMGGMAAAATGLVTGAGGPVTGSAWAQGSRRPDSLINGVQLGVITYSFRSMPDQSAEALLRYCIECGISAVELMGDPAENFAGLSANANAERLRRVRARIANPAPLTSAEERERTDIMAAQASYEKQRASWRAGVAMTRFTELRRLYADAGVDIYGFKPSAFEVSSTDAEIDYGMRAAKALGATHVTVELPAELAQSARLGAAAARHGLKVGYHQHLQATPTLWDPALAQSEANAINLDLGHYTAAGSDDGIAFMRRHFARITSMHLKDRQNRSNGQANLPWGTGDTPVAAALRLMRDQKYGFPATIELEYEIPPGSDAVREVRKCLEFCRGALNS